MMSVVKLPPPKNLAEGLSNSTRSLRTYDLTSLRSFIVGVSSNASMRLCVKVTEASWFAS